MLTPSGEIHHYVPAVQVPSEMESLLNWYKKNQGTLHHIELAGIFHHRIASIHPFPDGNGRVSRICMNFILMKAGFYALSMNDWLPQTRSYQGCIKT